MTCLGGDVPFAYHYEFSLRHRTLASHDLQD